jgi:ATP-binding protein involved in chromosome partitioning
MSYWSGPEGAAVDLFGRGGGRKMADRAGVPFLGEIPIDPNVRIGGDEGRPVALAFPDSPVSRALRQAAELTAARISVLALQDGKEERTAEKK